MATRGLLCMALLLLLSRHASLAQNDADQPVALSQNEPERQTRFQQEAANEELCVARNTMDTSQKFAEMFQQSAVLRKEDFRRMFTAIASGVRGHAGPELMATCARDITAQLILDGNVVNCSDALALCPSIDEIYSRHSTKEGLNYSQLAATLQEAAFSLANPKCHVAHVSHKGYKPTTGHAWGYGIGFVTAVCIISNIGGLLTPFMSKTFFQRLLQFLVAMGAGTLAATGLLVLIPEAFDIVSMEEIGTDYIWKAATALFSIYVFFVSERFLKFFLKARESKSLSREKSLHVSPSGDSEKDTMTPLENGQQDQPEHGHSHLASSAPGQKRGAVASLAWMVLMGDVIHNFVDGMAIGAAFTENVYLGVSIGIAVLCEELPHELGDVAILLHSGMSMKRALLLNFLSACVCYLGLVLGIVLGENTEANRWILAIAGGLFLYVPLVDMLPDMSQHLDMKMREGKMSQGKQGVVSREVWLVLTCQSAGLLLGICIILVVVNFSGEIEISR